MKAAVRSLQYPFKKDSLQFLNDIVRDLRLNVDLTLQILNLDTAAKTTQTLMSMNDLALDTAARIRRLELTISQASSNPSTTALTLKDSQSEAETVGSIEHLRRAIVYKPELHQMLCDESRRFERLIEMGQGDFQFNNSRRPKCRCRQHSRRVVQRYSVGPLRFFQEAVMSATHYPTCPLHFLFEKMRVWGATVSFNWLLSTTVDIAFQSIRGAGGRALSPYVKYRATVPYDSPAFALVHHDWFGSNLRGDGLIRSRRLAEAAGYVMDLGDLENRLNDLPDRLVQLFRSGEASPDDVNPTGRTVAHELLYNFGPYISLSTLSTLAIAIMALKGIGVPVNDVDVFGDAIADKDMQTLKQLLIRRPSIIHEKDNKGHTAIHASLNWTYEMMVLFEHGGRSLVNEPDMHGLIPLSYAIQMRLVEAAQLLLDNGSSLSSPGFANTMSSWRLPHVEEAIFNARGHLWDHGTGQLWDHILNAFIIRRHKLAQ
ncbi:MAG: hypothetical protein Q9157_009091 [Trypethelium eluteriae]